MPEFEWSEVEFVIRISGSSMHSTYSSGDILACQKTNNILFFQWGKVFVIDSSQGQLVKRIYEHENPDMLLLVSNNREKYLPLLDKIKYEREENYLNYEFQSSRDLDIYLYSTNTELMNIIKQIHDNLFENYYKKHIQFRSNIK